MAGMFGPVIRRPTARPVVLATVTLAEAFVVVAPVRLAGAATLAKSRMKLPPLIVRAPVIRLSFAPLSVNEPPPILARESLSIVFAVKLPEKSVVVSSRPKVSVVAVPPEFLTVPEPVREPTVWAVLLISNVAPAAIEKALRTGMTLALPARTVPPLMTVLPS